MTKVDKLKKKHNIVFGGGLHYDYVKDFIRIHNHVLISTQYNNHYDKLNIKCNKCESITSISFKTFSKRISNSKKCKKCFGLSLKLDFNVILKEAKNRGHIVLSKISDYKLAKSKLRFKCQDNHVFMATWDKYYSNPIRSPRSNGCSECGHKKNSLNGAYNYKGFKPVRLWIRNRLKDWKKKSLQAHNYRCFITGEQGKMEVHHTENFSNIFYMELSRLDLPNYITIGEYSSSQLLRLEKAIHKAHKKIGIPMLKEKHKQFHHIYGNRNNTYKQVLEFKNNYRLGVF